MYYSLSGCGPVIVFAHGIGGNYRSWWQQVADLAADFTCLTFSHRGFQPSSDVTGSPRPEWYARDLATLLDHLSIPEVSIVAQSMGGWTAMEFALSAPKRVRSLFLSGTTGTLRHERILTLADIAVNAQVLTCRAMGVHPAAGERLAREQPELYETFITIDRASGGWDRTPVRAALDRMRTRIPKELTAIRCPVHVLVGAEDLVCPPSNVEILASSLPRIEMSIIPEAGHSVYFERAGTFNKIVRQFLNQAEALR